MYVDDNLGFWGAFANIGKAALSVGKVAKTAAGVSKIAKVGSTFSTVTKGASIAAKAANIASTTGKVLKVVSPISNKVGTIAQTVGAKIVALPASAYSVASALPPATGTASNVATNLANVAMGILQAGAQIAPQVAAIRDGAQYGTPGYQDLTNAGVAYQVEPDQSYLYEAQARRDATNYGGTDLSFLSSPGLLLALGGAALLFVVSQSPKERVRYRTRYRRAA